MTILKIADIEKVIKILGYIRDVHTTPIICVKNSKTEYRLNSTSSEIVSKHMLDDFKRQLAEFGLCIEEELSQGEKK